MKKILMILIITVVFFACDDKPDTDTHTHTWSDWQSNAEQHWKECSCGAKTDIGNHTGNPCTICGYEEIATLPQPTQKILSFGKVTISSEDEHLPSAWDALCNDVVSSLETAYSTGDSDDKMVFEDPTVFGGNGVQIVLVNDLPTNWEVNKTLPDGAGVKGTLYIKTDYIGSMNTSSYAMAALQISANKPYTPI